MTGIVLPKSSSLPEMPMLVPEENPAVLEEKKVEEEKADPVNQVSGVIAQDEINMNHELRLQQIEAILLRIRGAI